MRSPSKPVRGIATDLSLSTTQASNGISNPAQPFLGLMHPPLSCLGLKTRCLKTCSALLTGGQLPLTLHTLSAHNGMQELWLHAQPWHTSCLYLVKQTLPATPSFPTPLMAGPHCHDGLLCSLKERKEERLRPCCRACIEEHCTLHMLTSFNYAGYPVSGT